MRGFGLLLAASTLAGCGSDVGFVFLSDDELAKEGIAPLVVDPGGEKVTDKGTLAFGVAQEATLSAQELHGYSFAGRAGGRVRLSQTATVYKQPDTYVYLFGPPDAQGKRGSELVGDDDKGGNLNSLVDDFALPVTGSYLVVATSYRQQSAGTYRLLLECLNGACQPEQCTNGKDDDGDGLADCADSDCKEEPTCKAAEVCDNGKDDDADGLLDCADLADCARAASCSGQRGKVALGYFSSVALHASQTPIAWGTNAYFPLPSGGSVGGMNQSRPVAIPTLPAGTVRQLSAGVNHACALLSSGTAVCWGHGSLGELGSGWTKYQSRFPPGPVMRKLTVQGNVTYKPVEGITQLSSYWRHSCALLASGQVACWGDNTSLGLGRYQWYDESKYQNFAAEVENVSGAVEVSVGFDHSCALLASGKVLCWGDNSDGQLGDGTQHNRSHRPKEVVGLTDAVAVSAGLKQTCALRQGGAVSCWGRIDSYVAPGELRVKLAPHAVLGLSEPLTQLSVGGTDGYYAGPTCGLGASGRVYCWGRGYLGSGQNYTSEYPLPITGIDDALEVDSAWDHTCVRRKTGNLACFGQGNFGQLGTGSYDSRNEPSPVVDPL